MLFAYRRNAAKKRLKAGENDNIRETSGTEEIGEIEEVEEIEEIEETENRENP
ncbi:hypothetical protein [Methanosarcina sp. KYL-1]|uniref:hypothetical protein n=1 Tax=Methanosarcina sp. KYL-1 TaxID=2602068 RepID=UPI002100A433|nr:hypothetical protein [Methanosarcina sp. KYL-1]